MHRPQFGELFSESVANFTHSVIKSCWSSCPGGESCGVSSVIHCHFTLIGSTVLRVQCIPVNPRGSIYCI